MSAATIYAPRSGEAAEPPQCAIPGCELERTAMVYAWRPHGMSVYEPRCRDHKGGA